MSVYPSNLPTAVLSQLRQVYDDPRSFFRLLKVWDKGTQTYVPFVLNDEQEELLDALLTYERVCVLKPRQVGVSTLLRAFAFWQVFTSPNPIRWGTISLSRDSANNLQRMDHGFLDSLPVELTKHRKMQTDKATEILFGDTGASTATYTAGGKNGTRSYSLGNAHVSEFAFYEHPEELLSTVVGTVGSGRIVIETTPNAHGDAYHKLVEGAMDGSNGWHLVSFWWYQHHAYRTNPPQDFCATPDEEILVAKYGLTDAQVYWRRQQVATMGPTKFRREYPGCMEDAFAFLEGGYFTTDELAATKGLRFPTTEMTIEAPRTDDVYVVGADPGGGVGADYSALTVIAASTRQVVYCWRSNTITPAAFADKLVLVAGKYRNAMILVESNNHGHVTLQRLTDLRYNNLWVGKDNKFWTTTASSKLAAYESLREIVGAGLLQHLPEVWLAELHGLRAGTLAPSAVAGSHDDCAVSLALAYYCLRSIPAAKVLSSKHDRVEAMLASVRARKQMANPLPWKRNV